MAIGTSRTAFLSSASALPAGRRPRQAAHCSASASLTSVQRGHAHCASAGIAAFAPCLATMIELARVGGGVAGDLGCMRDGGRESERGFGRLGLPSPAPRSTRRTVGRGIRDDEEVAERLDTDEDEDVKPLPGWRALKDP